MRWQSFFRGKDHGTAGRCSSRLVDRHRNAGAPQTLAEPTAQRHGRRDDATDTARRLSLIGEVHAYLCHDFRCRQITRMARGPGVRPDRLASFGDGEQPKQVIDLVEGVFAGAVPRLDAQTVEASPYQGAHETGSRHRQ